MTTIMIKLNSYILEQDTDTLMEQLNIQTQKATTRTLQALCSSAQLESIHYNPPIFLPQLQSIAPSNTDVAPPPEVTDYLEKLVQAAQKTAESHYCGSFVAGQISESDEFADVGVWLGEGNYQRNHEKEIMHKLGLVAWADADIYQMEGLYDEKLKAEGSETSAMGKLLESLEDCHRFLVRRQDSYFACFLMGRLKAQGGWCGLASIGVET
ncbi:uncharacterized protein EDB91DRAFT_1229969 [Suillus paluster]|uniref:uncharacterized protein n=1 Tax=Suillus paluster TaxID=48578 RepID=UPI001B868263|nr:uncharacterized protein EDB91DRAFT_1229969 [Suillus paluster]KAG1724081.1 hypothetical protein EDB91DRAFT_1229969 [Suillus paluster]